MTEADLVVVRDRCRLALIERLCLAQFLMQPVFAGQMTVDQSHGVLREWLEAQRDKAGELYGAHFQEPGMTALYSEEMANVVERMTEILDKAAAGLKRELGQT